MEGVSILARVQQTVEAGNYVEAAEMLEAADLEDPGAQSTLEWPHALHLLCLVYASRLEDARFLYKRTPDEVRGSSPELPAAWEVLQRLWVRDYAGAWVALGRPWSAALAPVAVAIAAQQRQHVLRLVGRAYARLSPAKLAALVGTTEEEAVQGALEQGWELDGGMVAVRPKPAAEAALATADHLRKLSQYTLHLES